jgi:hypothetical protein
MITRIFGIDDFISEFKYCERDNFSYKGYESLYNYFDNNFDNDYEIKAIAIDSSYGEMNKAQLWDSFNYLFDDIDECTFHDMIEVLRDHTSFIVKLGDDLVLLNTDF